jgi:hypothetical protein
MLSMFDQVTKSGRASSHQYTQDSLSLTASFETVSTCAQTGNKDYAHQRTSRGGVRRYEVLNWRYVFGESFQ